MSAESAQIAAIGRALAILDLMASEAREFGVTEISNRLGLSKPIVSRILAVLSDEGEVIRNDRSGQFSLTLKRPMSAIRFWNSMDRQVLWMALLRDLATNVGELVELSLFHAGALSCIASIEPVHQVVRVSTILGSRLPLHATAAGKAWLAFAPREIALPLLLKDGLPKLSPRTITSLDDLLADLENIRQRGYAIAQGEYDEGAAAVAAPIRLGVEHEWLVGSLCVATPIARAPTSRLMELGLAVVLAAHRLSQQWPTTLAGPYLLPVGDAVAMSRSASYAPEESGLVARRASPQRRAFHRRIATGKASDSSPTATREERHSVIE